MSKYKVAVYAICKNEEKFVSRWVESMSEADNIYVLDTGSCDKTVEKLKSLGVTVKSDIIDPWRFDVARNRSLDMVPDDVDICVCTDIDEVFHKGWRKKMENIWTPDVCRLKYRYTWNFNTDGSEGCVYWVSKAHQRQGFKWIYPVHEVLEYSGFKPYLEVEAEGVQMDHHADDSKSRSQYLDLLKLAVKEDPSSDRNMHYLGREYMFNQMWPECRETLMKHLQLETSTWKDERCASMRFIARACNNLNLPDEEEQWIFRAIAEAPYLREPWIEASSIAARKEEWSGSLFFAEKALSIVSRSKFYINESDSWGSKPYDLAAVASYYCGFFEKALEYGKKALNLDPTNQRLKNNLVFYEQKFNKNTCK